MTRIPMRYGVLLLALLVLGPPAAFAYEDCEVSTSARQKDSVEGYKYTEYTFEVALSIDVQCANINYALVIDERLENGELRKVPMSRTLNLRSNQVTEYHEYKTLRVNEIEGIAVEGVRCSVCL